MKSRLRRCSPVWLVWTIAGSNLGMMLGFTWLSALSWHLSGQQRLAFGTKLPWLVTILVGTVGTLLAEFALGFGMKRQLWPETSLAPLRKFAKRRIISVATWSLIAATLLAMVLTPAHTYF